MPGSKAAVTELRLALVCYGGVSLAIYMHGVTKELHKLVSASAAFHDRNGQGPNPYGEDDTRRAYFEALKELADAGRPLKVTVDVIAGTSAGGINGVCLAKAIAANSSQDALKQLWMEKADFKVLLRPAFLGSWKLRAARAALALLRRAGQQYSPLDGTLMSRLLFAVLDGMDRSVDGRRQSLLDPDASLDLFITATDLYGENVVVATGAGGFSQRETDHAQVLHFRRASDQDDFGADSAAALAFAARATSCFPGAFQPVNRHSFLTESGAPPAAGSSIAARFRNRYGPQRDGGYLSDDAWLADGGILDNAPFDLAVRAIAQKRAETEVVRRLVYIQPDPGGRLRPEAGTSAPPVREPSWLEGTRKGALSVRGSHSVLRELLAVRDLNLQIETIGALAASQAKQVEDRLRRALDDQPPWNLDRLDQVEALSGRLYTSAEKFIGAGYQAYVRLKVDAAARRLADAVTTGFAYPPDSGRASAVRAAIGAFARASMGNGDTELSDTKILNLLGPVDVPYKERRLLFVLAGVDALYAEVGKSNGPTRDDLRALKGAAWTLLTDVRTAPLAVLAGATGDVEFLRLTEAAVFTAPDQFAAQHREEFTHLYTTYRDGLAPKFANANALLWRAFEEVTAEWAPTYRQALLSRVVGFPIWDSLLFPTIALSDLPQFTPIEVAQFSPDAALALDPPAGGKLAGVGLHHFGAFADRDARENDYLWGRLDGVELALRTLRSAGTGDSAQPASRKAARNASGPQLGPALAAVLASEADLTGVKAMSHIRDQLASVTPPLA